MRRLLGRLIRDLAIGLLACSRSLDPGKIPTKRTMTSRGATFNTIISMLRDNDTMTPAELQPACGVVIGSVYGCLNVNRYVFEGCGYGPWRLRKEWLDPEGERECP